MSVNRRLLPTSNIDILVYYLISVDVSEQHITNLSGNLPGAAAPVPEDPQKHVRP